MIDRRLFILGASGALAGCVSQPRPSVTTPALPYIDPYFARIYDEVPGERYPVPAVDLYDVNPDFLRRVVDYGGSERPGTVIVDSANRYLYLVQPGNSAIRYGVGVGREGFGWSGAATIRRKSEWPTWTPPASMIRRQPELEPYANGMPPGLDNPLGARALYLYQGDRDTLFRIHGTIEPNTIGTRVSSGCIRMINQDVIDLYGRVPLGTRVVVLRDPRSPEAPDGGGVDDAAKRAAKSAARYAVMCADAHPQVEFRRHSRTIVNREAPMSSESEHIRSQMGYDRLIRRVAVFAFVLYAAGCTGITYIQLAHL